MSTFEVKAPDGRTLSIDGPAMPSKAELDMIFTQTGTATEQQSQEQSPDAVTLPTQMGERPKGGYTLSDSQSADHQIMNALSETAHPQTMKDFATLLLPTEGGLKLGAEALGAYFSALKNSIAETKSLRGIPATMLKVLYKEAYPAKAAVDVEHVSGAQIQSALFNKYYRGPTVTADASPQAFQSIIDSLPKAEVAQLQKTAAAHVQDAAKAVKDLSQSESFRKLPLSSSQTATEVVNEDLEFGKELGRSLARLARGK